MRLKPLPPAGSWNHQGLRVGFEVAFFRDVRLGHRLTVSVRASRFSAQGTGEMTMTRDAQGHWIVDGTQRPDLDGCVDVDFESSTVTNTLPIHRLDFVVGASVDVPAAFVRADDLRVERLEQRYTLVGTTPDRLLFHYESSTFDFACDIPFDRAGVVVEYPGIAVRTPTGRG